MVRQGPGLLDRRPSSSSAWPPALLCVPQAAHRREVLQHCWSVLQLQQRGASLAVEQQAPPEQQQRLLRPRRLLLFNLFALEAYSIAEALQVPCCVLQPYLIPYSVPAGFRGRLQAADPRLAAALLQAAAAAAPDDAAPGAARPQQAAVSWKDVSWAARL